MFKKVQIIEKRCGAKISEYLVALSANASDEDYHDLAWKCAIKELNIEPDRRMSYQFKIA